MIDTPEQIREFLTLSQKTQEALKTICSHLNLETTGGKTDLILRLISVHNNDSEMVAISSKIDPLSTSVLKKVRNLINQANQSRIFNLQTQAGKKLNLEMKYIPCPEELRSQILSWCLSINDSQKNLITLAKGENSNITVSLVSRPVGKDNWIMAVLERNGESQKP